MISKRTYKLLQWVDKRPQGALYDAIQKSSDPETEPITSTYWNQMIQIGLVAYDGNGYRLTERGHAEMDEYRHLNRARMRSCISLAVSILSLLVSVLALVRTF